MFKHFRFLFFLCFFSSVSFQFNLRAEPSDVVVLLDTSGSLLAYYEQINEIVVKEIFANYVRHGDVFHLISFNASPNLEISQIVDSQRDFSRIVSKFLLIHPLAKTSDILVALDFLQGYLPTLPRLHDKKLIFISDGLFTPFAKHSNYTQKDFEKELSDFSAYLVKTGKIQTYYIQLPISSNQFVVDLKNDLSVFAIPSLEMVRIEAFPLISNLPLSLKEYLMCDEVGNPVFRSKNLNSSSDSFEKPVISIKSEDIKKNEGIETYAEEVKEIVDGSVTEIERVFKIDEDGAIPDVDLMVEENTKSFNTTILFNATYIFLIIGIFLALILFFVIKRFFKKHSDIEENIKDKNILDSKIATDVLTTKNSENFQDENTECKNEVLLRSTENYLDPNEDSVDSDFIVKTDKELKKETKSSKQVSGVSEAIQKEERILLTVKTFETKLKTEYSPTVFTLSPDTKKAFAKDAVIENMLSLLNANHIDTGDVFHRFKSSLYIKKYVKNVDVTKKNYLEMFVANQRRSIGMRNIHPLIPNKIFYLGGGRRDDFLIFLVPIPRRIASIRYNEKEIIFTILEPKYFPYEKELEIRNPIDRFFVINSDKNYPIHFMFRLYEKGSSKS